MIVIILAVAGAVLFSVGAGVEWGAGAGLMYAGVFCVTGAWITETVLRKRKEAR